MQPPSSTSEPFFERFEPLQLVALGLALAFLHLALYGVLDPLINSIYLQMALAVTVAMLAAPSVLISLTESSIARTLRFEPLRPSHILWLLILTLALPWPILALDDLNIRLFPIPESYELWIEEVLPDTTRRWIQAVLTLGLIGPVGEEVVFRGIVQQAARRMFGGTRAVLAVALVFAALHVLPSFMAGLMLLGIALGLSFERTGSLLAPVLLHVSYNLLVLVAQTQGQDLEKPALLLGWNGVLVGLGGAVIAAVALSRLRPVRPW
jgi:membrane protease YdiL (CAAX protease family)